MIAGNGFSPLLSNFSHQGTCCCGLRMTHKLEQDLTTSRWLWTNGRWKLNRKTNTNRCPPDPAAGRCWRPPPRWSSCHPCSPQSSSPSLGRRLTTTRSRVLNETKPQRYWKLPANPVIAPSSMVGGAATRYMFP